MKLSYGSLLTALALSTSSVSAACAASKEHPITPGSMKLSFSGYEPTVKRTLNTGVGNKIVLRGYQYDPVIEEDTGSGVIQVSLGEPCDGQVVIDVEDEEGAEDLGVMDMSSNGGSMASTTAQYLGWGLVAGLMGLGNAAQGTSPMSAAGSTLVVGAGIAFLSSNAPSALAQDLIAECELAPIEVEIFVDGTGSDDPVNMEYKTGDFEVCPPETMYWKHHPAVFGGYEGCVAERGLYPCASDALGVSIDDGNFYAQSPVYWDGQECVETTYTMENRTFWIQWGHPMDKHELQARTGMAPVVSFPFNRQPYSLFARGQDPTTSQDDSNDARLAAKDLMEYIGAWTVEELEGWSVTMTEGAEQGMVHLFAAKALEIASTTCNRNINVLMQVPSYGYSTRDAANIANRFARDFYNSSECLCFADDSCKDPTVTIDVQGWLPNTPFPTALGGDNITYAANSDSPSSPWFESMVFPENPSGVFKKPQLADSNRRVCDGVYLWPMYMGARGYVIPKDELPDCSGWAFSISKIYSAAARAGWIMYKQDPETNHEAVVDAIGTSQSLTHGSLSEWTWHGQLQLFEVFMSKPLDDPTSWIGAYSTMMQEKWDALLEGFEGCPITQVSNPYSGAYAYFVFQEPYLGIQDSSVPSFFFEVLGIQATTYSWGFRGADPADFYGEGYGTNDFTRLQMYRDVDVYKEVGRRAAIVCADQDATIGDNLISVNQWVSLSTGTRSRRLTEGGYKDFEDRKRHLKETLPELSNKQVEYVAKGHVEYERQNKAVERCAPEYTTQCLFNEIGVHGEDNF